MEKQVYRPQGNCASILYDRSSRLVTVGPAGTGKTRAVATKIFLRANKYPRSRHLICRQTRKSCTDTCLVTWEDEVLPPGHESRGKTSRTSRHSYRFANGSEVVVGGLDDPQKLFSSQWDTVWINEAIEATEGAIDAFARGMRNNRCSYHQIILDTNPGPPTHWLLRWIKEGRIAHIPTTHKDNGRYYDDRVGDWTPEGLRYLDELKQMTGARYTRLYLGEWSTPEGARWPYLDTQVHRFAKESLWPQGIPEMYAKWISIDHGFGNPYCALWNCSDREGNIYTYREDYGPGFTADEQVQRIVDRLRWNEQYAEEILDPSMWHQDPRARGKMPHEVSAAEIYEQGFARASAAYEAQGKPRPFGPVRPGTRVTRENMFLTLDKYLQRSNGWPNWFIEYDCVNLWAELVGATLAQSKTTGLWSEDLDPACPDHAITSAGFGIVTRYPIPAARPVNPFASWDHDEQRRLRLQQRLEDSENDFIDSTAARDIRF